MRRSMYALAATALAVIWIAGQPSVHAQVQTAPPGKSAPSASIPDHKLDAAAAAIQRVAKVSEDFQQQIAAAPPPEKERIAKEANTAMVKAVTDQGLSVDEYNSIVDTAQNDRTVHDKIMQRLKKSNTQ
jgi:Domain of unknown function (DUF4168)